MLEMGRIVPVYESLGGTTPWGAKLTSKWMRRVMWSVFEELDESEAKASSEAEETLPPPCSRRLKLPTRLEALKAVHFPRPARPCRADELRNPAHKRLIFEELFYLELGLELKRRRMRERVGTAFTTGPGSARPSSRSFPFHPTAAQKRVLGEIVADMRRPSPCAACCRAMSAPARPSSPCRPRWSPSRTATRPR
jgi:ATP-dependent DNA helicase RecG